MTGDAESDGSDTSVPEAKPFPAPLAFDDPRHLAAHRFLVREAALLDNGLWREWLELFTQDVRYLVPVSVTTTARLGAHGQMAHLDEDHYSLGKRIERLLSGHAWTEDPQSRTRHLVTNVLTFVSDSDDELRVDSTVLLFRSRGERPPEYVCAGRSDVLRADGGDLYIRRREVHLDEAVLRTQNLAIFL